MIVEELLAELSEQRSVIYKFEKNKYMLHTFAKSLRILLSKS